MTKPPPLWQQATVAQLTSALTCAPYAKDAHKLLVFKGLLLEPSTSLAEAGLRNGCVLHLVLNENPYTGRALYIQSIRGHVRAIKCGPDFYIQDVKEELSYFPGERTPEQTRLVFAGRLLQDQHSLREYNIQKPSMLLALGPSEPGRGLSSFVASVLPGRNARQVLLNLKPKP